MGLLRECLFALRARQGDAESIDDKSLIEAEHAHPPHLATPAGQTLSTTDRSRPHMADRQALPRRGD
jgi:hypothetical protein